MTAAPAPAAPLLRHDWSLAEIEALLRQPLVDLLWQAQQVHRQVNPKYEVQLASLVTVDLWLTISSTAVGHELTQLAQPTHFSLLTLTLSLMPD